MKKYIPSAKNNNQLKEETVKSLKSFSYGLNKGKYNKELDKDTVNIAINTLDTEISQLENAVGLGNEDILNCVNTVLSKMETAGKDAYNSYSNRFATSMEELCTSVSTLRDVTCGYVVGSDEEIEKVNADRRIRKLTEKIEEISDIKDEFAKHETRLEGDTLLLEKDIAELEDKMVECDNERILNDLYRRINAVKSKINTLNVRRTNYSSCYNILDMIESNAKEIVIAGQYSQAEIALAKVILNMNKIRETISDPEKVIPILKMMEKNIKDISEKIKNADEKMFNLAPMQTEINKEALDYKEELLKKRRAKLGLDNLSKQLDDAVVNSNKDVNEVE